MSSRLHSSSLLALVVLSTILSSGCQTRPNLYHWGSYENLLYNMYSNAGDAEPNLQIERLTKDIELALKSGRKTPPGVHAHLGFMYAATGNADMAKQAFEQEKELFPESSHFIDGMMKRASRGDRS